MTGQRRERRLRIARVLLARAREDASSPLRRIVCAALARACDALMRDEICELSDVIVAAADNVPNAHDLATLAEASMMPDFQRSVTAYATLVSVTQNTDPGGRQARAALDALKELAQSLPWASTLRVSALRIGLLHYTSNLEGLAGARSIEALVEGEESAHLKQLEANVFSLAQLTVGARRRLVVKAHRPVPASGSAISMLDVAVEQRLKEQNAGLDDMLRFVHNTLEQELPPAIANVSKIVLGRLATLSIQNVDDVLNSFVPPAPKEAPLPPWLPGRRIIGGFYVLRSLGTGGVGSVFVVTRAEERHRDNALRFALKVPDYSAEAARTLSEEEFLNLFREEAGALLALPEHENLATFVTFDAGARPKPILVMELVEGPTLERAIERGDLRVHDAIALLHGISSGLATMHQLGIGHLDVKPSNVILRATDQGAHRAMSPVLVDFGLAGRQVRPGCATGPYGAPEIWGLVPDGCFPRPMAADTYAFACLAYEVLTGDTLFDAPGEIATINLHLSHDGYPEKLLLMREHAQLAPLCDLLANALRQHPEERISMLDLRNGLSELAPTLADLPWPLSA